MLPPVLCAGVRPLAHRHGDHSARGQGEDADGGNRPAGAEQVAIMPAERAPIA
jgi:hypothetical protein